MAELRTVIDSKRVDKEIQNSAHRIEIDGGLSGDTINIDCTEKNFFDIYLDRPLTRINLPTGITNMQPYMFQIRQDAAGSRAITWGNKDTFSGLNVTANTGMGGSTLIFYIHSGTFDWSVLRAAPGRKSYLDTSGFANNVNNVAGLKLSSFDESAGTITVDSPDWSFIDETTVANVTIAVKNAFYFFDEMGNNWISQLPFGVTMFEGFSTSGGASMAMSKGGVFSNRLHHSAKIRYEEELTDDFVSGSDNGLLEWREASSNGSVGTSSADVDSEHPGSLMLGLNAGETANCRCSTSLGTDMFDISTMRAAISGIIKGNTNSFSTADVKWFFGWSDTNQPQSAADGVYFMVVADGVGNGRLWCVGKNAGAETLYDTGIDLGEDIWGILHIDKSASGDDIHFAVNDVIVHKMNKANIGLTAKVTPIFGGYYDYTGTPLPNNKQIFVDAFSLKYRMSSDRI